MILQVFTKYDDTPSLYKKFMFTGYKHFKACVLMQTEVYTNLYKNFVLAVRMKKNSQLKNS